MNLFNRRRASEPQLTTTPAPKDALAIRISRAELDRIERLLTTAWNLERQPRSDAPSPVPEMMKALHKRRGATVAAAEQAGAEPDGIPFFELEVETVEKAFRTVAAQGYGPVTGDKQLVDDLHARLGYAEAVRFLGDTPVFRSQLPTRP